MDPIVAPRIHDSENVEIGHDQSYGGTKVRLATSSLMNSKEVLQVNITGLIKFTALATTGNL